MPVGVRELTVLGEFKPFGLVAEALDGQRSDQNHHVQDFNYFLFDPDVCKQTNQDDYIEDAPPSTDRSDYELFIRGNRITWSIGSRVYKRFTFSSPVLKTCWCRMGDMKEALLSVLQIDRLTMYNTSGEINSVPLPRSIVSIWPLPFGLLLQQVPEGNSTVHSLFPLTIPFSDSRGSSRSKKDIGYSPQHNYSPMHGRDYINKGNTASPSSHMILKDPLEEPEPFFTEERGRLNMMKEFDERTIWTSEHVALMASFNKVKTQHSVWVAEVSSCHEIFNEKLDDVGPSGILAKQYLFRRIWQGKVSQTASSKVFLATDDDLAPVISFLLQDQRKLLCMRLQSIKINNEITYDTKRDMSWSVPAIAAAPVSVTRPRVKMGPLPSLDIIALTPEYDLVLYSGKQCLCKYILPPFLNDQPLQHKKSTESTSNINDLKIVGLADAVEGRLNVALNNAMIYRCTLQCSPSSSLVGDCLLAMVDGLSPDFYTHFLVTFWGEGDLTNPHLSVDSEWQSFCNTVLQGCRKRNLASQRLSNKDKQSSWEFLINSEYHKNYQKTNYISGPSPGTLFGLEKPESFESLPRTDKSFYTEFLSETLDCLHAVYESMKLDILRKRDLGLLVVLLCKIAIYLGEGSYLDHYMRDFPDLSQELEMLERARSEKAPPNLLRWFESCLRGGCSSANVRDLPGLICKGGSSVVNWARKIVSFYSLLCGAEQSGRKLSSGVFCNITSGSSSNEEELAILAMVGEGFGLQQLDLLPAGASLPLRHALDKCRESPPLDWPAAAYVLLGREDLALSCFAHSGKSIPVKAHASMKLISMSAPYMLHLHPTTIHSSVSESIDAENSKTEDIDSAEGSVTDGMEHIFNYSTQLRFGRDLRLNEVRRLLCSAKPVVIQTPVNPTASDQDLQQAQLWQLAQRTTALPFGRGAFTLATTCTLLTEALAVPKLVLAGRLPAQQNAMVNLDPNLRNVQELKCWPEFHNAVAAGLRLSPIQGKASRTWILYNRPGEPDAIHAGLLLALGLHGHLKVLSITDIYQYYSLEHESTTVGLMLGLAASHRGTMKPSISKSLYVHIPARHPLSFPELELPTLLQSAAVMSVGLLYEGAAHPQTMQILLGEMGRRSGGDNVLEREGYSLSAGFALGLVALGRGNDAIGFKDTLVDRLFQYIGGKELQNNRFNHPTSLMDEHNRNTGQIMDGSAINIDVTAPGSTIALGLMYLKTESQLIVSRLSIPQTCFDLQYVRPDLIMLRVIARSLIMWSSVHPSEDWIQSQLPEVVKNGMNSLGDDIEEDIEAFVHAYINIVTGSCISLGLRFAGTRDGNSQELLHKYALYFLNEIKPVTMTSGQALPKGLAKHVDRGTLETCLHFIVLSLCVVMAGSGHLKTLKLLKFLRTRNTVDGHANYGAQMIVSLAIGFLFLGGGTRTFSTDNSSIAALLITLYPRLPSGPNDNRCHLQAFRHLYVLATEGRWIQTVDVDTGLPVYVPLDVTVKETENYSETSFCEVTPCNLPERAILKSVRVCGPRYWPQVLELIPEDKHWWTPGDNKDPFNSGVLYVKRKVGVCPYVDDPVGCRSLLSRAIHKVFGLTQSKATNPGIKSISAVTVDQLVSTFSSDPSLIAFAQLCCDPSWSGRSENDFEEFCFQILFECVSKDRPGLLQVYLSLYTMVASMIHQVNSGACSFSDCVFLSSLKLALAYNDALLSGRLKTSGGGIVQSTFLGSLRKRVEEILSLTPNFREDLVNYFRYERWPAEDPQRRVRSMNLSLYLRWYCLPPPAVVTRIVERMKHISPSSSVPFWRLLLPGTHLSAIKDLDQIFR